MALELPFRVWLYASSPVSSPTCPLPCWLTVPTSRVPESPLMLIYMGRRFLCFVCVALHPPPYLPSPLTILPHSAPFFLKLNEASEEQSKQTEKYCRQFVFFWEGRGRVGSLFVTACCMQPGGAAVWQTLCGRLWQPTQPTKLSIFIS